MFRFILVATLLTFTAQVQAEVIKHSSGPTLTGVNVWTGQNTFNVAYIRATVGIVFPTNSSSLNESGQDLVLYSGGTGNLLLQTETHAVLQGNGVAPVVSACGVTPSVVAGSDHAGSLTTGSGAGVQSCTLTFSVAWTVAPNCFVNNRTTILLVRAVPTTTTLTIDSAVAGTLASQVIDYFCVQGSI